MDEFGLIDEIVDALGPDSRAQWIEVGSGDDAAVVAVSPGASAVSSIDAFIPEVHFPTSANPADVGYRAFMASASDLAAMAATPRYALVALSLPAYERDYVLGLCQGMAQAAKVCGMAICGGNLTKGPLNITVSVHGEVNAGTAVLRSGAQVGDLVQVSGPLGRAAACVRLQAYAEDSPLRSAYFHPQARVDLVDVVARANAAVDISDGCLQDIAHIAKGSAVRVLVDSHRVPVGEGANLEDALWGGDDYELVATATEALDGFVVIGEVATSS